MAFRVEQCTCKHKKTLIWQKQCQISVRLKIAISLNTLGNALADSEEAVEDKLNDFQSHE